jgi:hypothetical protein
VIYYTSVQIRRYVYIIKQLDAALKLHKENENKDYYIILINYSKDNIKSIKSSIGGTEIKPDQYSKFTDFDKIKKEFDISDEEANNELGMTGAVYNRIALKDLK